MDLKKRCSNPGCPNPDRDKDGLLPATLEYFYYHSRCKGRLRPHCKVCALAQSREYAENNKERLLAKSKEYQKSHQEQIRASRKDWYQKHREYAINRAVEYKRAHLEQAKAAKARYEKKRLASSIEYRLLFNMRRRLNGALKGLLKASTTATLIGCSTVELRHYLEEKFQPGMSWANYGQWHIDHIRPCSSYDFSSPQQQTECFHFKNLQPLWAKDNWAKGVL